LYDADLLVFTHLGPCPAR